MSGAVRPSIWVNLAASVDGRIAFRDGARARLSGPHDLARVHRLRADSDAIVIGAGTVRADDPSLQVRWESIGPTVGRPPTRVIVAGTGELSPSAKVLDGSAPTIVAEPRRRPERHWPSHVERIEAGDDRVDLLELWELLARRGMRRVLVEGGARLLASVLATGAFDRLTVFVAPVVIGAEGAPPMVAGRGARGFDEVRGLALLGVERMDEGYVASYAPGGPPGAGGGPAPLINPGRSGSPTGAP